MKEKIKSRALDDQQVSDVISAYRQKMYLEEHIKRNLSATALAASLCVSRKTIERIFKSEKARCLEQLEKEFKFR